MELNIEGRKVTVDDKFRELSSAEQEETIEEIAAKMDIKAAPDTTAGDVGRGVASGGTAGAINIIPGIGALVADVATAPGLALYQGVDLAAGLAGYDTGLAKAYKPGGYFGHSAESARLSQELADKVIAPPVSSGGKFARAFTSAGVEALGGSGLFRVAATGQIFSSADDAARAAETAIRRSRDPRAALAVKELGADVPTQAAYSAAAGGGGEIAQQEGLPPIVGTALGLGGAAATHAAVRGVPAGVRAAGEQINETLTRTPEVRDRKAAAALREAATDQPALDVWAERAKVAEDAFAAEQAKGAGANPRLLETLDQARREAHGELVPGSKPTLFEATEDLGIGGAQRRAQTEDTGGYRVSIEERRAEQNAARLAEIEAVGGEGRATAVLDEFRRQRDEIDVATAAQERTAQSSADVAATRAGTTATPEAVGEALRTPVVGAERAAKAEGGRLYNAIGAEGVTVGTGRLKATIGKEFRDIPESPLSTDERHFANLIKGYGGRLDFNLLQDLRSEIAARSRQFTLPDTERRRFTLLKNAIDQAMDDGLAKAVAADPTLMQRAAASAAGEIDAAARRVAEGWGVPPPKGTTAPPPPPITNMPIDDTLTEAQRAANTHWREMKQTFGAEPVKPIIARAPTESGFKMTEAKVPETAFRAGNTGGEGIRALRAAGATDAALAEAAALSFAQKVVRDGAVDPAAFRRWLNNHAAAIRELPPEVQRRFSSAASAAATLEQVTTARQVALRGFDETAVGKALGIPLQDLQKAIGAYLATPSKAHELANAVANNPQAKAGLQRLVADHIISRFSDASDVLSKASLTKYITDTKPQLAAIFGQEGANRFQRLADDIERSRRQMVTGKDPAGPGTAGDLATMGKAATGATVMSFIGKALGPKGIAVAGAAKVIANNLKLAGLQSVDEVLARALLDPELARKLLTKAPALKNEKFLKGLGTTILRSSAAGAVYGGNQ